MDRSAFRAATVAATLFLWPATVFAGGTTSGGTPNGAGDAARVTEEATQLYAAHDYPGAIEKFTAAYALDPDPNFLYNTARCYEQLGDRPNAIRKYKEFLGKSGGDVGARTKAEASVARLNAEAEAAQAAPAPSASGAGAPSSNGAGQGTSGANGDAAGMALLVPRRPFLVALQRFGEDYEKLADHFGTTVTAIALRVGEVTGEGRVVVGGSRVWARGEVEISSEEACALARGGGPEVASIRIGRRYVLKPTG